MIRLLVEAQTSVQLQTGRSGVYLSGKRENRNRKQDSRENKTNIKGE